MTKWGSLQETIQQYLSELVAILRPTQISDQDVQNMMKHLGQNNDCIGSDESVKDAIGGHAFCITDNAFITKLWGHARTIGIMAEMISLRAEHGGAIAILLLFYPLHICYPNSPFPKRLGIGIDNSELVRRGSIVVTKLEIKQQLVLDYDLLATTQQLLKDLLSKIE